MKLSMILPSTQIITGFNSSGTVKDIINEVINSIYNAKILADESAVSKQEVIDALIEREREQTTAIGEGFAFPHARLEKLNGIYLILVVSPNGVDFSSMDRQPVKFLVFTLVPRNKPNLLLKTRAALMHFLMPTTMRQLVPNLSAKEIWAHVDASDIRIDQQLLAKDIMKPQSSSLSPDMTLEEAARELHKHHLDSLPLVTADNTFIHEFTCYDLFIYGIPKFFAQLQSISYVKNMNPFEKYFLADRNQKIGQIEIERAPPIIGPDATIMEIIFEMTTHNRHHLYVVDDSGKLVGVVDRFTIVDKILISHISGV